MDKSSNIPLESIPFIFFTGGIIISSLFPYPVIVFVLAPVIFLSFYKTKISALWIVLLILSYTAGTVYYYHQKKSYESKWNKVKSQKYLTIRGEILNNKKKRIAVANSRTRYKVLVILKEEIPGLNPGTVIEVQGKVLEPVSLNSLWARGILFTMKEEKIRVLDETSARYNPAAFLNSLRDNLTGRMQRGLPEYVSSFYEAILLGERSHISNRTRQLFLDTGTAHLLALSGLHVGFIAFLVLNLLKLIRISMKYRHAMLICFMFFYINLTGNSPSVVRAGSMLIIYSAVVILEKQRFIYHILFLTLSLFLMFNPLSVHSAGMWLTYGVTFSLIFFTKRIQMIMEKFFPKIISDILSVTLSAQILSTPILILFFHRLSVVSLPANLIVVPWMSVVLTGGIAGFIGRIILPFLEPVWHFLFVMPLNILLAILDVIHKIPYGVINTGNMYPVFWVTGSLFVFGIILYPSWSEKMRKIWHPLFLIILILIFVLFYIHPPKKYDCVYFIDVGQGDATLVSTAEGRNVLIDAGTHSMARLRLLPFLREKGINRLDAFIVSHPQADHLGGFPDVMEEVKVKSFHSSTMDYPTQLVRETLELLDENKVSFYIHNTANKNTPLEIGGINGWRVLHPPEEFFADNINEKSLVLLWERYPVTLLLTGDIGEEVESSLQFPELSGYPYRLLKTAHHGSHYSTHKVFLDNYNPTDAFISVGRYNRFGHPSPEVIERLENSNCRVFRTDKMATIEVEIRKSLVRVLYQKNTN